MTVPQAFDLGRAWYGGRLREEWDPEPVEEKQRMLRDVGLTDAFWDLA